MRRLLAGPSWRRIGLFMALSVIVAVGSTILVAQRTSTPENMLISEYPWQPDDLRIAIHESDVIVEGVIKEVQSPRWTTRDGQPPANITESMRDPTMQLRTPIVLNIERTFKGKPQNNEMMFTILGGYDGQYTVQTEDERALTPGTRILVLLDAATPEAGPWSKISPFYPTLFFVVNGSTLRGPIREVSKDLVHSGLNRRIAYAMSGLPW